MQYAQVVRLEDARHDASDVYAHGVMWWQGCGRSVFADLLARAFAELGEVAEEGKEGGKVVLYKSSSELCIEGGQAHLGLKFGRRVHESPASCFWYLFKARVMLRLIIILHMRRGYELRNVVNATNNPC